MPDWYHCNSKNCKLPSCECARTRPPGGLAPADIPQFVLVRGRVGGRRGGVQQVPARPLFAGQPAGKQAWFSPPPPPNLGAAGQRQRARIHRVQLDQRHDRRAHQPQRLPGAHHLFRHALPLSVPDGGGGMEGLQRDCDAGAWGARCAAASGARTAHAPPTRPRSQTNRFVPVVGCCPDDPNPNYHNGGSLEREVMLSIEWWVGSCGIPPKDIQGFQSPQARAGAGTTRVPLRAAACLPCVPRLEELQAER